MVRLIKCRILPSDAYLAGGTAVYLYLRHRLSVDLDFFTRTDFHAEVFLADVKGCFDEVAVELLEKDTVILYLSHEKLKFSLFRFPYTLLSPGHHVPICEEIVCPLASLNDIAAMKAVAINQRGSIRDFIDLFFILQKTGQSFSDVLDFVIGKYGLDRSYDYQLKTSFVYFDDAEVELDQIIMIKGDNEQRKLTRKEWEEMKTFFLDFIK
ncbi:MAG: nucleotidyl transferase AbiEii/AbiGii toxin family protein [Deltaproteobacteria bacterium]|nr:nucleotidyl transferase AbiEii/AbiGii toxin family protein [Deltaproteobacteria bacterium]